MGVIILFALLPLFIAAPIINSLQRGIKKSHLILVVIFLLSMVVGGPISWLIAFMVSSLSKENLEVAQQNKNAIKIVRILSILATVFLILFFLCSYFYG